MTIIFAFSPTHCELPLLNDGAKFFRVIRSPRPLMAQFGIYGDNARLDANGFSPFGKVSVGMEVVDQFYADYGEGAPDGAGPDQERIEKEGNAYLDAEFPLLDSIKTARIVE